MKKLLIALVLLPSTAPAHNTGPYRGPIIDVHLHAETRRTSCAACAESRDRSDVAKDRRRAYDAFARDYEGTERRARHRLRIVSRCCEPWDAAAPDRIMKEINVDDPTKFMKPQDLD